MKNNLIKVVNILDEIEVNHTRNKLELTKLDKMINDLYHEIEFNYYGIHYSKMFRELKRVLKARRIVKDEIWVYNLYRQGFIKLSDHKVRKKLKEKLITNVPSYTNRVYSKDFREIK